MAKVNINVSDKFKPYVPLGAVRNKREGEVVVFPTEYRDAGSDDKFNNNYQSNKENCMCEVRNCQVHTHPR
uniref:Uncharacterized protein n=1 Tax=Arion vulgaris TaxID=1028688 RepID=A0A0B7BEU0_9EUPU